VNIQPLLDALQVQEAAARTLADGFRTQITELQGRLREAETQLEHLAITRKTVTALSERIPTHPVSPGLPEHPDHPIPAVFNEATGHLRARVVCDALDHQLLPKNCDHSQWLWAPDVAADLCFCHPAAASRYAGYRAFLAHWYTPAVLSAQGPRPDSTDHTHRETALP
jgi:hypothetical protein